MGFYGASRGVAAFLGSAAFLCLLLICISAPGVHTLYIFAASFVDGSVIRAGLWGYCVSAPDGTTTCPVSSLGYTLDATGFPGRLHNGTSNGMIDNQLIGRPLTIAFILWPLALGQTGLAVLGSLATWRPISLLAVLQFGGAFVLVLTSFIITCNVAIPAVNRMQQQFPPGSGHDGNVIWLGVAALICLFIAQFAMFSGHIPSKEERQKKRMNGKPGKRAPFGNVNWSDESLPRGYSSPPSERRSVVKGGSGRSAGTRSERSDRSSRGRPVDDEIDDDGYGREGYQMSERSDNKFTSGANRSKTGGDLEDGYESDGPRQGPSRYAEFSD